MKNAKRKQNRRMNQENETNENGNRKSNKGKFMKCPECSNLILLDWLKLKQIKFRRK